MKSNIRKVLGYTFGLVALLFAVGGAFGFFDMQFMSGSDFISLAAAPAAAVISGEPVTTEGADGASENLLRPTIDQRITLIQPDKFAFDTVLRNSSIHKQVSSYETKFYSSETRGILDTIKTAASAVTGAALWAIHQLIVTNIHNWNVGDNMLVNGVNGSDSMPLVFHVVKKESSTFKLHCIVLNGTGTYAADTAIIPINTPISRIGVAKDELDASTSPFAVMPQDDYNYCQIHMAQVEESFLERAHKKEVKFDMADMYNQAMWDYRGQVEFANLMGVRRIGVDPENDNRRKHFSGGIVRSITKKLEWDPASADNAEFYSWTKDIFTGNNGSDKKILFASPNLMEFLGGVPTVQRQLESRDVVVEWGVKFNSIITNFGELLVKHAPSFEYIGLEDSGLVIDPAFLEKHVWKPLHTSSIDYKSSGIKNADAKVISEVSCAVLKNLDTHALLNKKSA